MYSAYFDASGRIETKAVTVAGFVSSSEKWDAFVPAWTSILAKWKVSIFRMTDFVNYRGEYKAFTRDHERRRLFIEELVTCVRKHTFKAFSATVINRGWSRWNARYQLQETRGNPYCVASIACIELADQWAGRRGPKRPRLEFVFEDGDAGKGDLITHAKAIHGVVPRFGDKSCVPFQPADLWAWKRRTALSSRTEITEIIDLEAAMDAYEKSIESLKPLDKIPGDFKLHDAHTLLAHIQANKIPRRD